MKHLLLKTGLLLSLAASLHAQTTVLTNDFTSGTSTTAFSVIGAGTTSYTTDSGTGTLNSAAFRFQAANLNTLVGLFPSALNLGSNVGDTLAVSFKVRQEADVTGKFRFGLFNIGPLDGTGDDNGYYVDYGNGGSNAAWYATGGPAYYGTFGTPKDTTYSGSVSLRNITAITPVSLTLKLTRTSTGADFDAINGSTAVYTVSHTSPITTIDEFAIFTEQARTIWIDDLTVVTGTAIPEPATWASTLGTLALLATATRRRRRSV